MEYEEKVNTEAISQVLLIGKSRCDNLRDLKEALFEKDFKKMEMCAKKVCGLTDESN